MLDIAAEYDSDVQGTLRYFILDDSIQNLHSDVLHFLRVMYCCCSNPPSSFMKITGRVITCFFITLLYELTGNACMTFKLTIDSHTMLLLCLSCCCCRFPRTSSSVNNSALLIGIFVIEPVVIPFNFS